MHVPYIVYNVLIFMYFLVFLLYMLTIKYNHINFVRWQHLN